MKKKQLLLFILGLAVFIIVFITVKFNYKNVGDIDKVLESKSYAYLSPTVKNYIKDVYEETGNLILTEKNKKENKPYLNPQYVNYLNYSEEEKESLGNIPISLIVDYSIRKNFTSIDAPSNYDLRNVEGNNYVTPVRNQGNLGLCWAFATAGAVESHLLNKNNESYSSPTQLITERQIDYITSINGIKDYKSEYVSFVNRNLGGGGNFYISTIAMANGVSLNAYNSFKPYNDKDLTKMELTEVLNYNDSQYEVNSTINMPQLNLRDSTSVLTETEKETRNNYLNEIKQNIINNGAAYVGTYMNPNCQYTDPNLNNQVIDVYNCNKEDSHAMSIIGWDDDLEYSYCADTLIHKTNISGCRNVVTGKGAWILKNSWGNETQYPYLTYDSLNTSVHFINDLTPSANKNWDNNYVLGTGAENVTDKTYYFSDIKIKGEEKIKKIKFIAETSDTLYNVKIYKSDGNFITVSKTSDLPGLITIDVLESVVVSKNSKIIISSDNGYIDKVSVFTSNIDKSPYINMENYENLTFSEDKIRFYADTKNIPSDSTIEYKLYNENNEDISDNVMFTNNVVAENNINTLASFSEFLESAVYKLEVSYNSNVLSTVNINYTKMAGTGTEENPYIITNSTQLSQIRNDLTAYYELGNDIDLYEDTREGGKLNFPSSSCPQGFGWEAINGFSGSLDGKGHSIKGLYQNNYIKCNNGRVWEGTNNGNGFIATANGNVTIKNLVLEEFDMNCQGGGCGALISNYRSNNNDFSDKYEYSASYENIILKNSKITGVYKTTASSGGGLFGSLNSFYGKILVSNIFLDINLESLGNSKNPLYLASNLSGDDVTVQNIQLVGNYNDSIVSYEDSEYSVLSEYVDGRKSIIIENIISTVNFKEGNWLTLGMLGDQGNFIEGSENFTAIVNGINVLSNSNQTLCRKANSMSSGCINATNINFYDRNTQLLELTKRSNYNSFSNFDDNWVIKTIDGIPRIPVLKFVDFEYTNIPNITINQVLNEPKNIYDFITPKISSFERISYKSNNENIVQIDSDGTIIPKSTGNTTIHIESYYDGYIKDVPISVTYTPHYNINFDANGGIGNMNTIEVDISSNYILPPNLFTKTNYVFKEWNTEADGTGISYLNEDQINAIADRESITLYAQWIGEDRIVTFNANGGTVFPETKTYKYGGFYEDLPIPTREGFGFCSWFHDSILVDAFDDRVENNHILEAHWESNGYTIIYDSNGGTLISNYISSNFPWVISIMSKTIATSCGKNGANKTLTQNLYTKDGYIFKEWNTKVNGKGDSYSENQIIQLAAVENSTFTLYAIWEKATGVITFNSNDGHNQTTTQTFTYNEDTKLTQNLYTKDGYKFKEWNTKADGAGTSYEDEQTVNISENLILYAIWEETFDYRIGNYVVSTSNDIKQILNIKINTTAIEFKKDILLNKDYSAEVEYKTINNQNILFTGGKTKIYKSGQLYDELINIVMGDINGDGAINSADLLKVRQHLLGINYLSGIYFKSSDINYDQTINSADLLRVRQHLLEIKPVL